MPFKFSPGHCGESPCGCGGCPPYECSPCCMGRDAVFDVYVENPVLGDSFFPAAFGDVAGDCNCFSPACPIQPSPTTSLFIGIDFSVSVPWGTIVHFSDATCGGDTIFCPVELGYDCTSRPSSREYRFEITCEELTALGYVSITLVARG